MMIKWIFRLILITLLAAVLHYNLPQRDIVRITDTYEKRVDPGANSWFWSSGDGGSAAGTPNRDVFFIQTTDANGNPRVYRNEDTGFGWPPYFKFNTSNLQARAADLISKADDETPQWVAVTHYGWRNELLSIFPNATKVKPVDGPDVQLIPWFNIVFLIVFAAVFWAVWVRWVRFRRAKIDPTTERISDWFADKWDRMRGRV